MKDKGCVFSFVYMKSRYIYIIIHTLCIVVNEINNVRKRKTYYQCKDDLYFGNNDR